MSKKFRAIILERILRLMARGVLWKYRPRIVGITGSIGKTSAREAVFAVLSPHFRVRENLKNYNNEIGLPLTIIGTESGNRLIRGWLKVFFKWLWIMIFPVRYPETLVLEMGVDRPGDMDYLLDFIRPTVGVVTNISSSHLQFFRHLDGIAKEKSKLVQALPKEGLAVLNNDDDRVMAMGEKTEAETVTYGFGEFAAVAATQPTLVSDGGTPQGLTFKLSFKGSVLPVRLPRVIAPHLVYAALAAVAVGDFFKLNLVEIAENLKNFAPPSGRMQLLPGIKKSSLIDDSYNSSPASTLAALQVLEDIDAQRKIAVLGDMLELGVDSESGHRKVAEKVYASGATKFLAVGDRMSQAARLCCPEKYAKENILYFGDPLSAGRKLQEIIRPGDLVLIKGSQGMRMEKIVEEVMQEPQRATEFLCRQSSEWLKNPYNKP